MSTPKEKAKELINKYLQLYDGRVNVAKQASLIAVDGILKVIDRDMNYQNVYSFYLEVKSEIEKL